MTALSVFKVILLLSFSTICNSQNWKPSPDLSSYSIHQVFPDSDEKVSEIEVTHSLDSSHRPSSEYDETFQKDNYFDEDGSCAFNKFAIDHEALVEYQHEVPKLEQFTLCLWMRFTNHNGDHVLFTYKAHDEPREIQFWVANANSSSFINMAVRGHSLYRLNYPLGLKKWHHACTSWNGKTGEWQLWMEAERVGRGFYNRLVSHEIEPKGTAFSGGKSNNGPIAPGYHMEITALQLYSVALSAGKAHRNHKHHHVHKFDHNGEIEPTTTPAPPAINQPINPLLANGQIPTRVKINLAGVNQQEVPTINTNFIRGQFNTGERNLQQQLIGGNFEQQSLQQARKLPPPSIFRGDSIKSNTVPLFSLNTGFVGSPSNVQFNEKPSLRFKRQSSHQFSSHNDQLLVSITDNENNIFDSDWYDGLAKFGDKTFKQNLSHRGNLEDEVKEHDREPAEGEVEAVKSFCNNCLVEPFENVLVLAWKSAKSAGDVLKAKTIPKCGDF